MSNGSGLLNNAVLTTWHPVAYGAAKDDVYLYEPWLLEALREASSRPAEEAVCGGLVATLPWDHAKQTFKWMSVKCGHAFGTEEGASNCVRHAFDLVRPFVNTSITYGAAIFCTNAALAKLRPFLTRTLVTGYMQMWESQAVPIEGTEAVEVGDLFRDYLPVSDVILGLCMAELGVRLFNFDDGGPAPTDPESSNHPPPQPQQKQKLQHEVMVEPLLCPFVSTCMRI